MRLKFQQFQQLPAPGSRECSEPRRRRAARSASNASDASTATGRRSRQKLSEGIPESRANVSISDIREKETIECAIYRYMLQFVTKKRLDEMANNDHCR